MKSVRKFTYNSKIKKQYARAHVMGEIDLGIELVGATESPRSGPFVDLPHGSQQTDDVDQCQWFGVRFDCPQAEPSDITVSDEVTNAIRTSLRLADDADVTQTVTDLLNQQLSIKAGDAAFDGFSDPGQPVPFSEAQSQLMIVLSKLAASSDGQDQQNALSVLTKLGTAGPHTVADLWRKHTGDKRKVLFKGGKY